MTLATLLLATNLIGPVINPVAVATIESGGNTRAVGKLGERGLFQLRRAAWRTAAPGLDYSLAFSAPHALHAFTSYSLHLASQFRADTSRWPSAQEFYCMYNLGPTKFRRTYHYDINLVPIAVRKRAATYARLTAAAYTASRQTTMVQNQHPMPSVRSTSTSITRLDSVVR